MQKVQGATASVQAEFRGSIEVQSVINTILFVFERASRGYLASLNRSFMEKVMTILQILRSAVKADGN